MHVLRINKTCFVPRGQLSKCRYMQKYCFITFLKSITKSLCLAKYQNGHPNFVLVFFYRYCENFAQILISCFAKCCEIHRNSSPQASKKLYLCFCRLHHRDWETALKKRFERLTTISRFSQNLLWVFQKNAQNSVDLNAQIKKKFIEIFPVLRNFKILVSQPPNIGEYKACKDDLGRFKANYQQPVLSLSTSPV